MSFNAFYPLIVNPATPIIVTTVTPVPITVLPTSWTMAGAGFEGSIGRELTIKGHLQKQSPPSVEEPNGFFVDIITRFFDTGSGGDFRLTFTVVDMNAPGRGPGIYRLTLYRELEVFPLEAPFFELEFASGP